MIQSMDTKIFKDPKSDFTLLPTDKEKHSYLRIHMEKFYCHCYTNITFNPRRLKTTCNRPGLYLIVYCNEKGNWTVNLKFGMSMNVYERLKHQKFLFAALVMTQEEVEAAVTDEIVDEIIKLDLPFYNCDDAHIQYKKLHIQLQLMEGFFGCAYVCSTKTLGECLVGVPSNDDRALLKPHIFSDEEIALFPSRENNTMLSIGSWIPLRDDLYDNAKSQPATGFLHQKLLPKSDSEQPRSVTIGLWKELYGETFAGFKNLIEKSPRQLQVQAVVQKIRPLLQKILVIEETLKRLSENDSAIAPLTSIRDELHFLVREGTNGIQDSNYSSFVRPTTQKMALAAKSGLQDLIEEYPSNQDFNIERYAIQAIEKEDPSFLDEHFNWDEKVEIFPQDPGALAIVTTKNNQRMLIGSSDFIAHSPTSSIQQIKNSMRNFLAKVDYLVATGNLDEEKGMVLRKKACSFLMHLNLSPRKASQLFFEKGYFPHAPPHTVVVSSAMGIGYLENLLLQDQLGPSLFHHFMKAHGFFKWDKQVLNPSGVIDWLCPGPPGVGTIQAEDCNVDPDEQQIELLGKYTTGNFFEKCILCQSCVRKMRRREIELYTEMKKKNLPITAEQEQRHHQLQQSLRNNVEYQRKYRTKMLTNEETRDPFLVGRMVIQRAPNARVKKRKQCAAYNKSLSIDNDDDDDDDDDDYHVDEKKEKKKKLKLDRGSGHRNFYENKMKYPKFFMDNLERFLVILVQEYGEESLPWEYITGSFDVLLNRHLVELQSYPKLRQYLNHHAVTGKLMYLKNEYKVVANKLLNGPPPKSRLRTWMIINPPSSDVRKAKNTFRSKFEKEHTQSIGNAKKITPAMKQEYQRVFIHHYILKLYDGNNNNDDDDDDDDDTKQE